MLRIALRLIPVACTLKCADNVSESTMVAGEENHMSNARNAARIFAAFGLIALFAVAVLWPSRAAAQTGSGESFVQRSGTRLTLAARPFAIAGRTRMAGARRIWSARSDGAALSQPVRIDDAFATAAEMGARVVRSQTMGDTVGCALCIEPEEGKFNDAGFQATDYALMAAHRRGMKIIVTLIGDCATCQGGGIGQYLAWHRKPNPQDFFTDPGLIAAYEKHVDAVLNHVNPLNGVRYKDDPTILAWENCNMCGLIPLLMSNT